MVKKGKEKFIDEQKKEWRAKGWDEAQISALVVAMELAYDAGWDQGVEDSGYSPSDVREANQD